MLRMWSLMSLPMSGRRRVSATSALEKSVALQKQNRRVNDVGAEDAGSMCFGGYYRVIPV